MDEILKEIDAAFQLISSIPVTNDSVDKMAVARSKLRNAYAQLTEMNEKEGGNVDE